MRSAAAVKEWTRPMPEGNANGPYRQLSINFDPEMFVRIKRFAAANRVSFAEAVRTLCEWSLDGADE